MMDSQNGWFHIGTPQCGLLMGAFGIALAFMLIFMGFWKTLIVAVLFTLGFWLGSQSNKAEFLKRTINKLFPPKGE